MEEEPKSRAIEYIKDPAAVAKKIHVPTYDEILERIKSRYPRRGRTLFEREMARLQATYDILMSKTDFIRDLVRLVDGLHPFYWKLIEIDFDRPRIHQSIKCVSRARKLASNLYEKYRVLLMASENRRELIKVGSEGRGRILSTVKKCRRSLEYLRDLVVFIQHLPSIDASLPTIIVAGAPSTGKSTFVRNVSRAQTKIASYPFTTTNIHIGHVVLERSEGRRVKIQVIDTPGLLDRPFEEMNPIERRAVAALEEIEGAILFLVDVSGDAYMSVERQYRLLSQIINNYSKNKKIFIGINKIDISDEILLDKALEKGRAYVRSGAVEEILLLVSRDPESARGAVAKIAQKLGLL